MDGRDALVVVGMNGEPLPIEHGFPARLVVPGLYGYVSATKWLTEIELTTFAEFDHYWLRRGWAQQAPIKLMSRIDTPAGPGQGPRRHACRSPAWRGRRRSASAPSRCSIDDGAVAAGRARPTRRSNDTWRQWVLPLGRHAGPPLHRRCGRSTPPAQSKPTSAPNQFLTVRPDITRSS